MLKYLRYALATFCFVASVGYLALWGWSLANPEMLVAARCCINQTGLGTQVYGGGMCFYSRQRPGGCPIFYYTVRRIGNLPLVTFGTGGFDGHRFGHGGGMYGFPIWYAALIFALAGVASLRLGHCFTIRSAIVATTVVAVLLGMAVIL